MQFGNDGPQYLIMVVLVFAATVVFSGVMKKVIYVAGNKIPTLFTPKSKATG